ncbi:glycosyltransferase family 61 protein [Paenibacillus ginsengarvi]|uniref:Glycosyltransferase family 61 protein n=1 Tax=Paenibacillus ginsengarvi TaxID=400777 RepID=A0A3B0CIW1_9BACL|nr:glycosyltransferase family 61 protein [Paenibacillus ginsengarvi]RKN85323.1 glycosyltransferase family 61 protein [Paenibacillus ginsengarvi]
MNKREELVPPSGYYRTFDEWADMSAMKGTPSYLETMSLGRRIVFQPPVGLENPPHWVFRKLSSSVIRERHGNVAVIPGGKVCGIECDIITPDNKLIGDYSLEWKSHPSNRSIWKMDSLPQLHKSETPVAVLALKDSNIYYHWMMDVLPTFHLLKQSGIKPYTYVINGKASAPFQFDSLEMLGISRKRIVLSHPGLHISSPLLVVPRCIGRFRSRWSIDFLRRELMTSSGIKPSAGKDRIYISRERASKRKLLNENEVMNVLGSRGFRKVHLEGMPLTEQIRLFASAEAVAGPHGAGLTNTVFCNPGTRVIEMFSPRLVHTCYPMISGLLGLKHYYLVGTGDKPPEYVDVHDRHADIRVDVKELVRLLDLAGIR